MSAILTEELGPRGQRRVRVASIVAVALIAALLGFAVVRFAQNGEFEGRLWSQFTETDWLGFLFGGLVNTMRAALAAMLTATVIGFALALGRLARSPLVSWASRVYVEFFRSVPVLLFILFSFLGLPVLGIGVTRFTGLVIGLTAYNSAVLAEIFRAGILSLDRGQFEASKAIGLTYWQSMRLVILPQAVRRMIPAIVAQLATLTKDTSLGFVIGYEEFLRRSRSFGEAPPSNILQSFFAVAVVYFVLIMLLSRIARRLEVQQRRKYGAGRIEAGGGLEDLDALGGEADQDERLDEEAGERPTERVSR